MGKRITGLMAVMALSASLLAGCGQSNTDAESAGDIISIGEDRTETQRLESNAGTGDFSENGTDTENMAGIRQRKVEVHSWKSGSGIAVSHL